MTLRITVYSAGWCQPCHLLEPIFDRVADSTDDVEFVKVNIDAEPELTKTASIMSVPTMVFEKDGKVVDKVVGVVTEQDLRDKIEELK